MDFSEQKMTQMLAVYNCLKERMTQNRGLTSMEAIEMFGATRLSAIVFILKKRLAGTGYTIISEWRDGTNRYGEHTRFVEYKLVKTI